MHLRLGAALAATWGLVMALAGCVAVGDPSAASASAVGETGDPRQGAMAPYMAVYHGSDAELLATLAQMEELISQCMKDRGFEYTPEEPIDWSARADGLQQGSAEYIARFGYGVTPIPGSGSLERPARDEPDGQGLDESESYTQAFTQALHGTCDEEVCSWNSSDPVDENSGCWKMAAHEVAAGSAGGDPGFAELIEQWNEIWMPLQFSQDMEVLNEKWSSCMADAGYPGIASPNDASTWVEATTRPMWNPPGRDATEADIIKAHDIDVAVASADAACQEKVGWMDHLERQIVAEAEKFVAEHRAELDTYAAKYAGH